MIEAVKATREPIRLTFSVNRLVLAEERLKCRVQDMVEEMSQPGGMALRTLCVLTAVGRVPETLMRMYSMGPLGPGVLDEGAAARLIETHGVGAAGIAVGEAMSAFLKSVGAVDGD